MNLYIKKIQFELKNTDVETVTIVEAIKRLRKKKITFNGNDSSLILQKKERIIR